MAAILALGAFVTPARATSVTATFSNVHPGEVVTITDKSLGINGESGWAGVYNFINATGALSGSYSGFCIDIAQSVTEGQSYTWNVSSLANAPTPGTAMGQHKADLIAELWAKDYASIGSSDAKAAAFQIDLWAIINESGGANGHTFTLTDQGASFYVTAQDSGMLNTAQTWLNSLSGTGPQAGGLIALTSDQTQDYVVQTPQPPGVVLGVSAAACLLFAVAWKRRGMLYLLGKSAA